MWIVNLLAALNVSIQKYGYMLVGLPRRMAPSSGWSTAYAGRLLLRSNLGRRRTRRFNL
jgi:hypothetical protein